MSLAWIPLLVGMSRDSQNEAASKSEFTRGKIAERLPREVELALFPVFQEALTNVRRHANARSVDVENSCEEGNTILIVRDDGNGTAGRRAGPVSCWTRWQLLPSPECGRDWPSSAVLWMCNPAKVDPWFKPHCPSPPAIRMTPEPLTPSTALSKLPRSSALQRHRRRLRKSQKPLLQFHARPEDSRFNELRSDIQRRS